MIESTFLHNHPRKEKELGLDENHVIVDREDWEIAKTYVPKDASINKRGVVGHLGLIGLFNILAERRSIIISGENMIKYPDLPSNVEWKHANDPDVYLEALKATITQVQFEGEYLCNPKISEESIKSLVEELKAYEPKIKQDKKHKGHERPYKFHR